MVLVPLREAMINEGSGSIRVKNHLPGEKCSEDSQLPDEKEWR